MRRDDPEDRRSAPPGGPADDALRVLLHGSGAPALRLGLGPAARSGPLLRPAAAVDQLQTLFDRNSFWACGRGRSDLIRMLRGSQVVATLWDLSGAAPPPAKPGERATPAWPACPVEGSEGAPCGPPSPGRHPGGGAAPRLLGFGRATSDGRYRAVLWDVVVDGANQGRGLGRRLVEALLTSAALRDVERIYLMTTNSRAFYERLGFRPLAEAAPGQEVLVRLRA